MSNLTDEQRLSVGAIDSHVLVSAGAGSGKTHVLVERYIEILKAADDRSVSNLVAVTYTNKAANEMRSRLKARMQTLLGASTGRDRELWSARLGAVDGARIGTIHSLCESILKAHPIEAAVDPHFEVLDEIEKAELIDGALELSLHEAAEAATEEADLLLNYPIEEIKKWVETLIKAPLTLKEAKESLPGVDDIALTRHCRQLMDSQQARALREITSNPRWHYLLNYLRQNLWQKGGKLEEYRKQALALAEQAAALCPGKGAIASGATDSNGAEPNGIEHNCTSSGSTYKAEVSEHTRQGLSYLHGIKALDVRNSGGITSGANELRKAIRDLKNLIDTYCDDLPLDLAPTELEAFSFIRGIMLLSERALALYRQAKKRSMKMDFDDLINAAFEMLSQPGSPACRFYNKTLHAILVDEFQDTNMLQAKLLHLLCGENTRLFLIGDEKQSIYKFQGADVSIFNEWRGHFGQTEISYSTAGDSNNNAGPVINLSGPSLLVNLSKSFRSHPNIVQFINAFFQRLIGADIEDMPYRARFQALDAHRSDDAGRASVEVMMIIDGDKNQTGSKQDDDVEAQSVAAWIKAKVKAQQTVLDKNSGQWKAIGYGDFAVLLQTNKQFAPIEKALSELDIPYVNLAAGGFLSGQEIYDIESVLKFISCPEDGQSLVGALRSPMFAVADDVIHRLRAGDQGSLWAAAQRFCRDNPGHYKELDRAVRLLRSLISSTSTLTLCDLMRKIIVDTAYDVVVLAMSCGRQKSRNLWKLVDLAREHNELSAAEFPAMLDQMRALKVKQSHAPLDPDDSVKLMTIHGSKGLEFPAVALPALSRSVHAQSRKLLFHREYGLAFDNTREKDAEKPALFRLCRRVEHRMEEAEQQRLLYVAMTRARDCLGLFIERLEKDSKKVTLASWIKDVLLLDADGEPTADGVYHLKGATRVAGYTVTEIDSNSMICQLEKPQAAAPLPAPPGTAGASPENTGSLLPGVGFTGHMAMPVLDLIPPLKLEEADTTRFNWLSTLRVTPQAVSSTSKQGITVPASEQGLPLEESSNEEDIEPAVLGTFFHAVMEHLCLRFERPGRQTLSDLAAGAAPGMVHPARSDKLLQEIEMLLDKFWQSDLFLLMQSARKLIHEAPYVLLTADGAVAAGGRISGRSDLLLQDAVGLWHVIDYKTDHFDLAMLDKHIDRHRHQLQSYVEHIERLTKIKPAPSLYFAQHGLLAPIDQ